MNVRELAFFKESRELERGLADSAGEGRHWGYRCGF